MEKAIGLDLGKKTLGIATSDSLGFCHPLETFRFPAFQFELAVKRVKEVSTEKGKSINPNTQQGYIAPINDIKEQFGEMYLDDIKPIDVQNFLLELLDDRRYAKQTLKLRLIVLNLILNTQF